MSNNVLPFQRPENSNNLTTDPKELIYGQESPTMGQILDVTERILANQNEDRRNIRRVVLNEFIAAHVFIPGRGLLRITLKDIHSEGLAFEIDEREGAFGKNESLEIRFYLNHETYFRFEVNVLNVSHLTDEGVQRHGCRFVPETINHAALHHFVQFLGQISASLKTDRGERTVSNITS